MLRCHRQHSCHLLANYATVWLINKKCSSALNNGPEANICSGRKGLKFRHGDKRKCQISRQKLEIFTVVLRWIFWKIAALSFVAVEFEDIAILLQLKVYSILYIQKTFLVQSAVTLVPVKFCDSKWSRDFALLGSSIRPFRGRLRNSLFGTDSKKASMMTFQKKTI